VNGWLIGALALLVGAFTPAALLAVRGEPVDRLIGVEIGAVVAVVVLLVLAQGVGQPSYLIVPLVMVLVSFAGTLVYTRLLAPRSDRS
jgi:multisubunit Na+/H+ antiporter MnhF subunit